MLTGADESEDLRWNLPVDTAKLQSQDHVMIT